MTAITRSVVIALLLLQAAHVLSAASEPEYPTREWQPHSRNGWSEPLLKAARVFSERGKTSAVFIVQSGRVVDQWGEPAQKIRNRSARKSFLSALYGIYAAEGRINLAQTLADLGVEDKQPLSAIEKQASIIDLLRARSGVYLPAAAESPATRAAKPPRGSHAPGEFFLYNNWDFNALGGIFEKLTGETVFEALERRIAQPIGMQDFVAADGSLMFDPVSQFPAHHLSMTARDMARFGYLYLRKGRWEGRQIVPAAWVTRSTTAYSTGLADTYHLPVGAYGLLWWVGEHGFFALGNGGHVIAVIPSKDLVIVHRVDNDEVENVVPYHDVDTMIRMIIAAAPNPTI